MKLYQTLKDFKEVIKILWEVYVRNKVNKIQMISNDDGDVEIFISKEDKKLLLTIKIFKYYN